MSISFLKSRQTALHARITAIGSSKDICMGDDRGVKKMSSANETKEKS